MNYQDFIAQYNPERKCYAVYVDQETKIIERGLILDAPYEDNTIRVNNFHTAIHLSDITAIIITSTRWSN